MRYSSHCLQKQGYPTAILMNTDAEYAQHDMISYSTGDLRWNTSFATLTDHIDYIRKSNILLFVKFLQLEYDCVKNKTNLLAHHICPASIELEKDRAKWYIHDYCDLSDALIIEVPLHDGKSENDMLGCVAYDCEDNEPFTTYGIISAFAAMSTDIYPKQTEVVLSNYCDDTDIHLPMSSKKEANKVVQALEMLSDKIPHEMHISIGKCK